MSAKATNKNRYLAIALLLAVVLILAVGGVSAYLAMSSGSTNDFEVAQQPEVTVSGTSVTVDPKGYSLYLRVAIDAAWEQDGVRLPQNATEYTVSEQWKRIGDFYYYPAVISGDTSVELTPVTYTPAEMDGYVLTVHVAAQIIQAVGTTDEGNMPAVQDAWGVTPEQILGN